MASMNRFCVLAESEPSKARSKPRDDKPRKAPADSDAVSTHVSEPGTDDARVESAHKYVDVKSDFQLVPQKKRKNKSLTFFDSISQIDCIRDKPKPDPANMEVLFMQSSSTEHIEISKQRNIWSSTIACSRRLKNMFYSNHPDAQGIHHIFLVFLCDWKVRGVARMMGKPDPQYGGADMWPEKAKMHASVTLYEENFPVWWLFECEVESKKVLDKQWMRDSMPEYPQLNGRRLPKNDARLLELLDRLMMLSQPLKYFEALKMKDAVHGCA
eukprot:GEMP01056151.1.p1 GENE.GEMP01056151.1~~GEMP01056151.1.p1  ORF type:complete len:270 (+),score=68.00 GEMP01056151.1:69-878(+)